MGSFHNISVAAMNKNGLSRKVRMMLLAMAPAAVLSAHSSFGATLSWDSSGTATTTPVDGSGTWDAASTLWFNGAADVMWPNDTTVAVFGSGGAAGTVTLGAPITAGGLTFSGSTGDYTIAAGGNSLTLMASPVVTVAGGQSPTISAGLAGSTGVAVNGPGTLNLSGDNSGLTGPVLINSGAVVVNAGSNLGDAGNSVALGTATAASTANLTVGTSVTVGSFSSGTNSATANVLTIGAGATMNVSGNGTLSGLNSTINAAFVIGTPNNLSAVTTAVTIGGGGTLNVSGGVNNSSFVIGVGNCNTSTNVGTATVDMSGLTNFNFTTGSAALSSTVGGNEFAVGHGNGATATFTLAANNSITAGTVTVGDNSVTPGLSATIFEPNAPSNPSTLNLGNTTNVINANSVVIGGGRNQGTIQWSNTTTTGNLMIAGASGGSSTANITIGNLQFGTPPSSMSTLNLKGHASTVQANTVILGELSGSSGGKSTTNAGGSVTFDTGTFTAVSVKMAMNASGSSSDMITGTFNQGNSASSTGVLNVTGNFWMADNTNTASGAAIAAGNFTIKGGVANIGCNIIDASTTASTTSSTTTLTLSGGTLNMQGFAIGPAVANPNNASLTTRHLTSVVLPSNTATLMNLGGTGINDGGLNMNGTGTLILTGSNTYTGGTTVTSGTLQAGAAGDVVAPAAPFTSGATNITNSSVLAFGSSQALVMAGAINGSGAINQNGTGTTILAANNGYLGGTTISKGTLQIGNGGATGNVSSAAITDNGVLAFNRSDAVLAFGNVISGSGAVSQVGPGTVVLTSANGYSGGTSVTNGVLQVGNVTALGFGGLVPHTAGSTAVGAAGTLDLNGLAVTQPITLSGGTLTNSSATAATVTNGVLAVGVVSTTGPFTGDAVINYSGGGGSGATVNAVLGLSAGSFAVINGGTGYANGTVAVTITGGGGTGATGTATVANNVVTAINITNPGTGYTTAPTITIAPPTTGTTATASGNASNFVLDGTQELTTGSGYTSTPTATLTASSGTAVLGTPQVSGIALQLATNSSIGGTGNIVVAGPVTGGGSLTKTSANTVTLQAPNTYSGGTTISGGTLVAAHAQALGSGPLTIHGGGTVQLQSGLGAAVVLPSVTFDGSAGNWLGTLDVTNNKLVVEAVVSKPAALANLQSQANSAIKSSTMAATFGIAVVDNAALATPLTTFGGTPVDVNSILVAPELLGDSNIDGTVDLTDLSTVLNNFGSTTSAWTSGNFDGAATIDLTDLSDVLNNFGASNPNPTSASGGGAVAAIATPEPASLAVAGIALAALITRRRRA